MQVGTTRLVKNADEAFSTTLRDLLEQGEDLQATKTLSTGSEKKTKNLAGYSLLISEPRQRLVWNSKRRINLISAVARFVWMMGANDRLQDIKYYEDKVKFFSDDQIIVPGSSYGARMINPEPGINQLDGIIKRLKEDPSTRRAAIAIYQAEDAIRESKDIPCTFGIFFQAREGKLHAIVQMRSNNSFILLPYNIFEFSLLAEAIAGEIKIPFGTFYHSSWSMHIYEQDYEKAADVISNSDITEVDFPLMPTDLSPIEQIKILVKLEADAREAASGFSHDSDNFEIWLEAGAQRGLNSYWQQFYFILLLQMCKKNNFQEGLQRLRDELQSPWKEYLPEDFFKLNQPRSPDTSRPSPQFNIVDLTSLKGATPAYNEELLSLDAQCEALSKELEGAKSPVISFSEYKQLRDRLLGDLRTPGVIAARRLNYDEVKREFNLLRREQNRNERSNL